MKRVILICFPSLVSFQLNAYTTWDNLKKASEARSEAWALNILPNFQKSTVRNAILNELPDLNIQ